MIAQVRAQDREASYTEGARHATANAVLRMLAARRIAVDDEARARLLGEAAIATLERWIERSATCATLGELFEDP